jgi:ADP-heptose:LPS heptosyltransferase
MHPDALITWLVRDKFVEVIETNPDIDRVEKFVLPEGHNTRQDAEHVMDRKILDFANSKFDKVYDLQYWPRYSNFYERATEDFISLRARNAGIDPALITDRRIELRYSRDDDCMNMRYMMEKGIYNGERKFITCNHISYAASAVWSLENYSDLVDILDQEHGVVSVFTGAPNEPIPEHCIDARGMPYREWSMLMRASNLWLGLDSGAVALACSSDVPIIKLHSPDFSLNKTGINAMRLRTDNKVLELCPAPTPETMAELIMENMR